MCAIAGIIASASSGLDTSASIREMLRLQQHRGPDGQGCYEENGVALGHNRLAIIDLSNAGHQPMPDSTGRFVITFNGEIYNYLELRAELIAAGHCFASQSDTEVLLTAYIHWGESCVTRLRGMFAFAIWDSEKHSLFAARDRLGIKPFHYYMDGLEVFAFASEIKALLPLIPSPKLNTTLAVDYLAFNVLDHHPRQTMFAEIERLAPGHTLSWSARTGVSEKKYWQSENVDRLAVSVPEEKHLIEEFRSIFEETLAIHLRSDVPVGTCLSGGLDSSSIVCVATRELHRRGHWKRDWQHVFSACFEQPELDERPYINEVVNATGCNPHFVFPTGTKLREDLETWLWHQEEPVGGTGTYAHFCVARLASEQGIKVLLDGQGADEQLAGYRKFILVYLRQLADCGRYLEAATEAVAFFGNRDILRTCSFVDGRRYLFRQLRENQTLFPLKTLASPAGLGIGNSLAARLDADMHQFSLPVLLRYEDRNTMAFGIESRVPFVDHVMVEFLAKLPANLRLRRGWTKYIMRQALTDVIPTRIKQRKTKLGFSTPESNWIAGPLAGWICETLREPRYVTEVVDRAGVRKLVSQFSAGNQSASLLANLFRLATFETWGRLFLGPGKVQKQSEAPTNPQVVLSY
jgi:asparagine synthase (glutamine-hydrolysing)